VTCDLPDFQFSTLRACIHFVPSQILAVDAVDADRKHREGLTCPDSLVVVGTKRESADSVEWHHEASSWSIMLASSRMRQSTHDCRIREEASMIDQELASYGALSIAVSAPFLSHFAMFVTCFCTVCLCFHEANLTCLAARCIPTRIRRRQFSVSKKCCGGSPATPCFSHYFNHGHLQ
jgi:hypothetical protein